MPTICPLSPMSPAGSTKIESSNSKYSTKIPMISNIATSIVTSTAKKFTGPNADVTFPNRGLGKITKSSK